MSKKISLCIILFLVISLVTPVHAAQTNFTTICDFKYDKIGVFTEGLCPVRKNNKTGFIDKYGKEVIKTQYDLVYPFRNGISIVVQNNKYGLINKQGKTLVKPQFRDISTFANNLFMVEINSKYGLINSTGKYIVKPIYDYIDPLSDEYYSVEIKGKCGVIDKTGKMVISPKWCSMEFLDNDCYIVQLEDNKPRGFITSSGKNGAFGMINKAGKVIFQPKWDFVTSFGWDVKICRFNNEDGKIGIVDSKGKVLVQPTWSAVGWFCEDIDIASYKQNGKWGIFNKNGKIVCPPQYDEMIVEDNDYIAEGLIPVCKDSLWGFVDYSGKEVIKPQWKIINKFINGICIVTTQDDNISYIDKTGTEILKTTYSKSTFPAENGKYMVINKVDSINKKFGIIDINGNIIIPVKWDKLSTSSLKNDILLANEGYTVFAEWEGMGGSGREFLPGKYYLINSSGEKLHEIEFNGASVLNDKYIRVNNFELADESDIEYGEIGEVITDFEDLSYGIMDFNGDLLYEPQFDYIEKLERHDFITVEKDGKKGIMDASLKLFQNTYWDEFLEDQDTNTCAVTKNGKEGFLILNNDSISFINPQFDTGLDYLGQDKLFTVKKNGKWGVISIPTIEVYDKSTSIEIF